MIRHRSPSKPTPVGEGQQHRALRSGMGSGDEAAVIGVNSQS